MDFIKQHPLAIYLIIVNISLFLLMGLDKLKAKMDSWRISEKTHPLFGLGGILGQQVFHHKTRKVYFTICFSLGLLFAIGGVVWYYFR